MSPALNDVADDTCLAEGEAKVSLCQKILLLLADLVQGKTRMGLVIVVSGPSGGQGVPSPRAADGPNLSTEGAVCLMKP